MSKHSTLIGWPLRDPKQYRFAIPNAVWEHKLKPVEFVILSYLCYRSSHGQSSKLTQEIVAECIHLSISTVKKYLSALVSKGLVASGLSLHTSLQCFNSKNYFTLPNEIFC